MRLELIDGRFCLTPHTLEERKALDVINDSMNGWGRKNHHPAGKDTAAKLPDDGNQPDIDMSVLDS